MIPRIIVYKVINDVARANVSYEELNKCQVMFSSLPYRFPHLKIGDKWVFLGLFYLPVSFTSVFREAVNGVLCVRKPVYWHQSHWPSVTYMACFLHVLCRHYPR